MMLANHTSRFHVATAAVRAAALRNEAVAVDAHKLEAQLKHMAEKERQYIYATGKGGLFCLRAARISKR